MLMPDDLPKSHYQALANFRYQLRRFLRFSEDAARAQDIEPQQHQLMLAVKGSPDESLSVGTIAERLQIQHHSAVELVARAEQRGLVTRQRGDLDRRQVFVTITPQGAAALRDLSEAHHRELRTAGPELIRTLQRIIGEDPDASREPIRQHDWK